MPRKTNPTPTRTGALLDELLYRTLKRKTRRVIAGNEVVEVDISSSFLELVRTRLKDRGELPADLQNVNTAELLRKQMGLAEGEDPLADFKMPELTDEEDGIHDGQE